MSEPAVFTFWVVVLAALLFVPVTRLIWVMSVRRLERKRGEALPDAERKGQLQRARIVALLIVIFFSIVFNLATVGAPGRG